MDGEAPFDNVAVGDAVTVTLLVAVLEKEAVNEVVELTVPEADCVADGVREEEEVIDIVTLSVLLGDIGALGLLLALAARDRLEVGLWVDDWLKLVDAVIVINALGVGVEVEDEVAVREGVSWAVGVDKPVKVLVADELDVSLDVRDGLAPGESVGEDDDVTLAVSVRIGKLLAVLLLVEVTVSEPDEEDVIVLVGDGVFVALTVAVALEESEILEVIEADAPYERELVGDWDIELDKLRLVEAVCEEVTVPEIVALAVGVTDGVFKALTVDDGVIDGETVALNEIEGEPFALPPMLSELVGVAVIVMDKLASIEPLSLPVLVPVGVELEVLEPVSEEELVGLLEGEFVGVDVADKDAVGDIVALNDKEGVLLAEAP
jgi:hypothetical protein